MDDRMISYYGKVFKTVEDPLRPPGDFDDLNDELYAADPVPVNAIAEPKDPTTLPSRESGAVTDFDLLNALRAIRRLASTHDDTHACAIEAHNRIRRIASGSLDLLLQRIGDEHFSGAECNVAAD